MYIIFICFLFLERAVASVEVSDWNTDVSEVNRSVLK